MNREDPWALSGTITMGGSPIEWFDPVWVARSVVERGVCSVPGTAIITLAQAILNTAGPKLPEPSHTHVFVKRGAGAGSKERQLREDT